MLSRGIFFRPGRSLAGGLTLLALLALFQPVPSLRAQNLGEAVITNRYANLRSGPGTKFQRIGRAVRGERFRVTDIRKDWYAISFRSREAWVFAPLVRLEQNAAAPEEVNEITGEIQDINRRIERITEKIDEVNERLASRLPQAAPVQPAAAPPREEVRSGIHAARPVSAAWALVPGAPRIKIGQPVRGYALLGATLGCAAAGGFFYDDYRSRLREYRALPAEASPEEFARLHERARDRLHLADGLFYAAAGLYAFNVLDYFVFLPHAGVEVSPAPEGGSQIHLSLVYRF